ncbi:MAG: hypothetical protein Q4G03_06820 [Planctomycetia bacterium]|nr:hypothetical protein [Planctomycetia bacterium]
MSPSRRPLDENSPQTPESITSAPLDFATIPSDFAQHVESRLNFLDAQVAILGDQAQEELPPAYELGEEIELFVEQYQESMAHGVDSREQEWSRVRRYLRKVYDTVSESDCFRWLAFHDFETKWSGLTPQERRAQVEENFFSARQLDSLVPPSFSKFVFELVVTAKYGKCDAHRRAYIANAFAEDLNAAFLLQEYACALDDYGRDNVEEALAICRQLNQTLLKTLRAASPETQTLTSQANDASNVETPRAPSAPQEPSLETEHAPESTVPDMAPSHTAQRDDQSIDVNAALGLDEEPEPIQDAPERVEGYYPVNEELARRAREMNSLRPYEPLTVTREYRAAVDAARKIAASQKEKVDPSYHAAVDAALDAYERRLARWYDDYNAAYSLCPSPLVTDAQEIPAKLQRQKVAKLDALMEERRRIKELLDALSGLGTGVIRSDSHDALARLKEKLQALKLTHEQMKRANKYRRAHGSWTGYTGELRSCVEKLVQTGDFELFNVSAALAEIRRVERRIEQLTERDQTDYGDGWTFPGGTARVDKERNRLQVKFDSIPEPAVRERLKEHGFRWAPSQNAWQRILTPNAIYAAKLLGYIPREWSSQQNGKN